MIKLCRLDDRMIHVRLLLNGRELFRLIESLLLMIKQEPIRSLQNRC